MFSENDFGHRIWTKTDRRARRKAKAIEHKRNQQVPFDPEEEATIGLTKEERRLRCAARVHGEIKEQYDPMRLDASNVTNYVGRHEGGVIRGTTLAQLYERLAWEALDDLSDIGIWRAEVAVAYACSSNWLVRSGSSETAEWTYSIPKVMVDSPANMSLAAA